MKHETKWLVVFPNEGWCEGARWGLVGPSTRRKALKAFGPIAKAYGGTLVGWSTHFGPRFVYEVPMTQCAGAKAALERAGFNVGFEYVTSQLARALAETSLPFSVHEALKRLEEKASEVIEEDDAA